MKLWEAILYAFLSGLTELMGVSFSGHANAAAQTLRLPALFQGTGLYLRAALCIGMVLAVWVQLRSTALTFSAEPQQWTRNVRRHRQRSSPRRRENLLLVFGAVPLLVGLALIRQTEAFTRLLLTGIFLLVNGTVLHLACRREEGEKTQRDATLFDVLLMAAARAAAVMPGLSPLMLSWSAGRICGLTDGYNLRLSYLLAMEGGLFGAVYYLIRGFLSAGFTGTVALQMLLCAALSAIVGCFAARVLRFLFERKKQSFFVYYCWEAAAVVLILALINQ